MSKILVTGAAGYIGSHFCAQLERQGIDYVAVDNLSRGHREVVPAHRLVVADIGDERAMASILRDGVESVVHFAAYAYVGESTENPALYYENNVARGFRFIEAVREAGIDTVVFSSSCTTYGNVANNPIDESVPQVPTNPYGDTKLAFERLLRSYERAYGMRCAILRYFNASGVDPDLPLYEAHEPETHLIPLAIRAARDPSFELDVYGNDYSTPDGTCVRDYIHVNDLADAHFRALAYLDQNGTSLTLNLGIGKGYSVLDVISSVSRLSGTAAKYRIGARRAGDPAILVADASRARKTLNWIPSYVELDAIVRTALISDERRSKAVA